MPKRAHAPLIGITCEAIGRRRDFSRYNLLCDHRYARAVTDAGGHPVLLPIAHDRGVLNRYLQGIDGLVIVGGDDVDPKLYGEKPARETHIIYPPRTRFERWLYRAGKRRRLPIFGICYGMQLINVLEGGTLHQHIERVLADARGPRIDHEGRKPVRHLVRLAEASRLAEIIGSDRAMIETAHHQAVRDVAPGFVVAAYAKDGIIEAIESADQPQILAVQWHPERTPGSRATRRLFDAFVGQCEDYHAREER